MKRRFRGRRNRHYDMRKTCFFDPIDLQTRAGRDRLNVFAKSSPSILIQ